jgi:hypothetical protein
MGVILLGSSKLSLTIIIDKFNEKILCFYVSKICPRVD